MNSQFIPKLAVILGITPWLMATTINVGVPESVRVRHPLAPEVEQSSTIMQLLAPTLLVANEQGEWTCQLCIADSEKALARIVTTKKNRRAHITSTWKMRQDMKWGDGTQVTNKDLLLTWQLLRATKHPAYADLLTEIEDIRPDDKDHFTWHAEHRGMTFNPSLFAHLRMVPAHLEGPVWREQNGNFATYMQKTLYVTTPNNKALFAGFYLPDEKPQTERSLLMTRNSNAPQEYKLSDAVRVRSIEGYDQARLELGTGGSVLIENDFELSFSILQQLKKNNIKTGIHQTTQSSNWVEYISFNIRNPYLADARIRQALAIALDRKALAASLQIGEQFAAKGLFAENDFRFVDFGKALTFNADVAAKTLQDTGWVLTDKDKFRTRGGKQLKIEVIYDASASYRKVVAEFLATSWRNLGVNVELKPIESSRALATILRKIDYTGVALFARHMDTGIAPETLFYSKAIPSTENDYAGQNFSVWRNSQVDSALDSLDNPKTTERERSKYYQTIAQQFSADVPGVPLFFHPKILLTPKPISGLQTFFGEVPGILRLCTTF